MATRRIVLVLALVWLTRAALAAAAPASPPRPNVVLVLADDMGYSDIGAYGAEIETPNLDRLAAGGLRFRQFYTNAKCSPTRASLLTGLYPHEAGMGDLADGRPGDPGPYQGYLPEDAPTIAEVLRTAGYASYMSGKWHVGDEPARWPRRRGFDRYFGLISGATSYYELLPEPGRVRQMARDDEPWRPAGDRFYATDAYTEEAVERIREHRRTQPGRPFFLYLAYTAPHFPLHALPEDVARYERRYDGGWDAVRAERLSRMRRLGVIDERHAEAPRPGSVPRWDEVPDKADWARRMAVYAAMVDRMDQGIGRVLRALEETGAREDTLVLFLSDNGGCAEDVAGRRLNDPRVAIGARGSYVAYKEPWAFVSNAPFRSYKNWLYEGGVITPLVASWPAGLRRPGRLTDEVGHVIDLLPTLAELAGAKSAAACRPLAGRSLAAVLRDSAPAPRSEPLFWAYGGGWAVRKGDWKLVHEGRRDRRLELFDLASDPTEQRDLAARQPERVAALRAAWRAWAQRVGARELAAERALP